MNKRRDWQLHGFTLVELLVVISVIVLLLGITLTAINSSKMQAKTVVCKSHLKQVNLASQCYTNENDGYYMPGGIDSYSTDLHRWHGVRESSGSEFEFSKAPIAPYLDNGIPGCPQKKRYFKLTPNSEFYKRFYENGNGGYGYNRMYVGSKIWKLGMNDSSCEVTAKASEIKKPSETLIFADTAIVKNIDNNSKLVKYPFAEPRFYVIDSKPETAGMKPDPSLHFCHRNKNANIAWGDGHVGQKKMARYNELNFDGSKSARFNISWFKPMDNSFFDLQ